jgi:hypothetical protein
MAAVEHPNQLSIPAGAASKPEAVEVLSAWIVDGGLQVAMQRAFDEPDVWGILLVDIARHAARIFAQAGAMTEDEALERIRKLWSAEIGSPTDLGSTSVV